MGRPTRMIAVSALERLPVAIRRSQGGLVSRNAVRSMQRCRARLFLSAATQDLLLPGASRMEIPVVDHGHFRYHMEQ